MRRKGQGGMHTESDTWNEAVDHNWIDDTTKTGCADRKADRKREFSFKPVRTNCEAGEETGQSY